MTGSPGRTHSPSLFPTCLINRSRSKEGDLRLLVVAGRIRGSVEPADEISFLSYGVESAPFGSATSDSTSSSSSEGSARRRLRRRRTVNRTAAAKATKIHHHLEEVPSGFGSPGNAAIRMSDATIQITIPIERSTRSRAAPRVRSTKRRIETPYRHHCPAIVNARNASA